MTTLASYFAPFLLNVTVKATIVLCLIAIIAFLSRRVSAASRHFVWALGLGLVLSLPLLTLVLPSLRVVLRPAATVHQAPTPSLVLPVASPPAMPEPAPMSHSASPTTAAPDVSTPPIAVAPATPALRLTWPVILSVVWLLGAVLALLPWILSLVGLRRLTSQTIALADDHPIVSTARAAQNTLGVRRAVEIRLPTGDGLVPVPMGWEWPRPTVLLPHGAGTWTDHRLQAVLLHEMAHVRRGDWTTQTLARFACALYWFHPLAWLAARQMRAEAECACDDLVLTAGQMPATDYAQHLLDVARGAWKGQGLGAGAVAMAHSPKIESRLRAVLATSLTRRPLNRRTAAALLALALLVALPLAALHPVAQARGAFWTAYGPSVKRRVARGILTFVYMKDVVSDKHPNNPITMNVTRNAMGHETYSFFDRRTGRSFRDESALRAKFLTLLAVGDKKRPGATPYHIPAALAAFAPSRSVFFTADQQKQEQGLAHEIEAWQALLHNSPVIITDADLMTTYAKMGGQYSAEPGLNLLLTSDGAKKMQTFTTVHKDEVMGIILDGRVLSAPIIRGTISNEGEISGGFRNLAEAQALSERLNAPAPTVSAADQLQLHPGFTLRYAATITDLRPRQALLDEYQQMRDEYQRLLKQNPHFQPVPEEALKPFSYFESHNPRVRHVILTISSGNGYLLWQRQVAGDTYSLVYNGHNTQSYGNGHVGASQPGLELLGMYECPLPAVGLPYLPLLQQATLFGESEGRQNWQAECTLNRFENDREMGLVQATGTGETWKITDINSPAQRSQYTQHQQFQGLWIASQMRVMQYGAGSVPAVSPQFKSFPEFMAFVDARRTPTDTCDYHLLSVSDTPIDPATLVPRHR